MTEAPGAVTVRDPTLYRVLVVAAWIPGDNDTRAEQRRVLLQRTLAARGLAPPDTGIPSREALAWKDEERWSAHVPAAPPAPGGWRRHSYGRSYHELLAILTGVEQQGRHAQGAAWDAAARAELDAGGAWAAGSPRVELDRVAEGPDPASALGEAWLWTGEWEAAPAGGWSGFGERRYGADACAAWPWGLLGHVPAGEGALGRFDLHTTEDEASRRERDRFLFQDLLVLVAERLKATEFHWGAYRRLMGPHLDDAERRIRSASEALPASASVT
jgi:hypothetical protein